VLATGGSAMKAVEVLIEHGVPEDRIIFINLVRIRIRRVLFYSSNIFVDRFAGRSPNLLHEVPTTQGGTCASASACVPLSSFPDHRVDRPWSQRKGIHHPWPWRFWGEEVLGVFPLFSLAHPLSGTVSECRRVLGI
jgi:hypothetical protein